MISHLYVNYGTITAVDLIENKQRMDLPFNQSGAIETYFDQIEDAVEFAEAGASPFTMVQIITKAFIQMFSTGLFKDECKTWNRLPPVSRDWATFKLIFTAAARELREMQAMRLGSLTIWNVGSPGSRGIMGKGIFALMVSESVMLIGVLIVLMNCCLNF